MNPNFIISPKTLTLITDIHQQLFLVYLVARMMIQQTMTFLQEPTKVKSLTPIINRKKSADNGAVTVIKTGNDYYFRFSDGIPDLKGVSFKKEGDNTLVNIDLKDGVKLIRINASSLNILYTTDGKTWTANASR